MSTSTSPLPPLFTTSPLRGLDFPTYNPTTATLKLHCTSYLSTRNSLGHSVSIDYDDDDDMPNPSQQPLTPSLPASPVFEMLTFEKIPIVPSSTAVSTDSEAISSSDWGLGMDSSRSGAQSPSLITCLFQSQSISSRPSKQFSSTSTSTSPYPTPTTPKRFHTASKPILRRDTTTSTSASEDGREHYSYAQAHAQAQAQGYGLGLSIAKFADTTAPVPGQLKKRPSALTFAISAVQPRPSASRSTSVSPMSSYTGAAVQGRMSPPLRIPTWSPTDECDDEEQEFVDSPLPIPGHESDSDEGYQEDEEGGFTSDEELGETSNHQYQQSLRPRPSWASSAWTSAYLHSHSHSHSNRRAATMDNAPSSAFANSMDGIDPVSRSSSVGVSPQTYNTTMNSPFRGRKTSISIVASSKPSTSRCSRHRSPPPPLPCDLPTPAPPAASSPSAIGLCRRRGSLAPAQSMAGRQQQHTQAGPNRPPLPLSSQRGWRSDDSAFFPTRRNTTSTATFKLPSASNHASGYQSQQCGSGGRKASLPTPEMGSKKTRCTSILRQYKPRPPPPPPSSIPMERSSGTIVPTPQLPVPLEQTTTYAPAMNCRRGSAPPTAIINPLSIDTTLTTYTHSYGGQPSSAVDKKSILVRSPSSSTTISTPHGGGGGGCGAREGLERVLLSSQSQSQSVRA